MVAEELEDKGVNNHPLENFLDVAYDEEKLDEGDIFYTTQEPDKVFVNFLGVESICHKSKLTFPSKSLMHKHLKSNCTEQNQENDTAPPPVSVLPLVIKSTASTKAVGSGYAFKG